MGVYDFSPDLKWFHVLFGKFVFKKFGSFTLLPSYTLIWKALVKCLVCGDFHSADMFELHVSAFGEGDLNVSSL